MMTAAERAEQRAAFAVKCIGEPCGCDLCRAAGVMLRALAYVPIPADEDLPEGQERRGHWIHGEALARWWKARYHFFGLFEQVQAIKSFPKPQPVKVDADDPLGAADDEPTHVA